MSAPSTQSAPRAMSAAEREQYDAAFKRWEDYTGRMSRCTAWQLEGTPKAEAEANKAAYDCYKSFADKATAEMRRLQYGEAW